MLENELGYIKTLVHLLEPLLPIEEVKLEGVYDYKLILHDLNYLNKILKNNTDNYPANHSGLINPIKDSVGLNLANLNESNLCLDCFQSTADLSGLIVDKELAEAIHITATLDFIDAQHDYDKIIKDNTSFKKIKELAREYISYREDLENQLSDLYSAIPRKYEDTLNDYLSKTPIKLDLIHKNSIGSEAVIQSLKNYFSETFGIELSDEEEKIISLTPTYVLDQIFHQDLVEKGKGLITDYIFGATEDKFSDLRELHEMAYTLLVVFAPEITDFNSLVKVPSWVIQILKLTAPTALRSKGYPTDNKALLDTAIKLYDTGYSSENLYRDFDKAFQAAQAL